MRWTAPSAESRNCAPRFGASAVSDRFAYRAKKKPLPQKEWTLNDYIEIARELRWIGETAKSVGIVLRDYRNYIHPYKELTDGVALTPEDAAMLWTVFVTLTDQILRSAASANA